MCDAKPCVSKQGMLATENEKQRKQEGFLLPTSVQNPGGKIPSYTELFLTFKSWEMPLKYITECPYFWYDCLEDAAHTATMSNTDLESFV